MFSSVKLKDDQVFENFSIHFYLLFTTNIKQFSIIHNFTASWQMKNERMAKNVYQGQRVRRCKKNRGRPQRKMEECEDCGH